MTKQLQQTKPATPTRAQDLDLADAAPSLPWRANAVVVDGFGGRGDLHVNLLADRSIATVRLHAPAGVQTTPIRDMLVASLKAAVEPALAGQAVKDLDVYSDRLKTAQAAGRDARQNIGDVEKARTALAALDKAVAGLDACAVGGNAVHKSATDFLEERARLTAARGALAQAEADVATALRALSDADPLAAGAPALLARLEKAEADAQRRVKENEALVRSLEPRVSTLRQKVHDQVKAVAEAEAEKLAAQVQQARERLATELAALLAKPLDRLAALEAAGGLMAGGCGPLINEVVQALTGGLDEGPAAAPKKAPAAPAVRLMPEAATA